jgi:hypothetical protein
LSIAVAITASIFAGGTSAHQSSPAQKSFKDCGTKTVYGRTLRIQVTGEVQSCAKVRHIASGKCKDRKQWACFSFRPPGPLLGWFPAKERFDPTWSTFIRAKRYRCSKATLTASQWATPLRGFPTRKQMLSDDIVRCRLLGGRTAAQVKDLLGRPTHQSASHGHRFLDYLIGPERDSFFQVDPEYLSVKFNKQGQYLGASMYQG